MGTIKTVLVFLVMVLMVQTGYLSAAGRSLQSAETEAADVIYGNSGVSFVPKISFSMVELHISAPDGSTLTKTFTSGTPYIGLSDFKNPECVDGQYNYELRITRFEADFLARDRRSGLVSRKETGSLMQSGTFRVVNGSVISPGQAEGIVRVNDVVTNDDAVITGSICVGFDCTDGMSFGLDTIVLKENSLRIFFDDTSESPFPLNDWRIAVNDSASGGASYFSVQDATNSRVPFKIEANARSNALYVDDAGRIGVGTSVPSAMVHILYGNTPALRLDQDGSAGWSAQVWEVAGNETNFFIRDITGGSKLPLRIQPATPTNTLTLKNDGKVGIGTWTPEQNLEIETTGSNAVFLVQRTDGVSAKMLVSDTQFQFGTVTNHPLKFYINNAMAMSLNTNNYLGVGVNPSYPLHLSNGAYCSAGGAWTDASSITLKENIKPLGSNDAETALDGLNPVMFNYIADKEEGHVGFIAEDVPALVAAKDRKGLSPMDIAAVLTRVVKDQQTLIREQQAAITELKKEMESLKQRLQED